MYFVYAIIGLVAGVAIADSGNQWLPAAIAGATIGVLLAHIVKLDRRIQRLESAAPRPPREPVAAWEQPAAPETQQQAQVEIHSPWFEAEPEPEKSIEPGPSILQTAATKTTTWLTTGNVPVKVGVIISFIGVAFLLKYAIDRELLTLSLELRLLAVAVAGLGLLATGWRLRKKERVYALSLQGGGVGILFLTIFAALQLWQLLPATLAFFLLVALTAFTGALAVLQNSRSLAMLGVVGGFLAPVLTSTGQGNHVVLFSYYLVLNGAVVGIAWFRAWRGLNLLGWVFTFLIGSLWGYQYYKPELLSSTQPFLVLYFLLYQAIAVLFALRQPPQRLGMVDGTLVFGTPIVVFALQAALVEGITDALAISAAVVALFYALLAAWLWRSRGEPLRLLSESFMALAIVFATITIPLLFDARWTAAAWAVEGAALVWVGTRQGRQLAKLAGTALVFLSGMAFMDDGWQRDAGRVVLNGNVLGGLLISLSAFFTSRKLAAIDNPKFEAAQKLAATLLFIWAVLWWLGTGWMEIVDRVDFSGPAGYHNRAPVFLLFLSLSAGAAAWLGQRYQWSKARRAALVLLPLLVLLGWAFLSDRGHFLAGPGWLAWPLAWAMQAFALKVMDEYADRGAATWHFWSLLLLTTGLALEASWWIDRVASDAWAGAVAATVAGSVALLVWRFSQRPLWPVPAHPRTYLAGSLFLVTAQLLLLLVLAAGMPGDADPWPYIPVFNPFDLAMLFAILTAVKSLAAVTYASTEAGAGMPAYFRLYKWMLAGAFFVLTTLALVRGVHQFTTVAWDADALFGSVIVQTALSVYWGLLGFAGMLWGARSGRRAVWLTGAAFMALVVIKLFVVDLGNTGTVERIISFIAIGALLLLVGYFAPVPPRVASKSAIE